MITDTHSSPRPVTPTTNQQRVDHAAIAVQIAEELGETKPNQARQIKHIVWALGHDQCLFLLHQAQAIQAAGGLLIPSGTRPRTVGGVWFWLVYTTGKPFPGHELRRPPWPRQPAEKTCATQPQTQP